jgi:GTP pyrophosphokinase
MRTFSRTLERALVLATQLHWEQRRKGDRLPYIIHPFSVFYIVSRYTTDEDTLCAALLHDVLEDVPRDRYDAERMRGEFGETVLAAVRDVTEAKVPGMSREEERSTWLARKENYLQHLDRCNNPRAHIICAADKIHNLSSMMDTFAVMGERMWDHFNNPPDRRLWFYGEVVRILRKRLKNPIVSELEATYLQAMKSCGESIA